MADQLWVVWIKIYGGWKIAFTGTQAEAESVYNQYRKEHVPARLFPRQTNSVADVING